MGLQTSSPADFEEILGQFSALTAGTQLFLSCVKCMGMSPSTGRKTKITNVDLLFIQCAHKHIKCRRCSSNKN